MGSTGIKSNAINLVWEHEGIGMQCFLMPYPPPYQREERPSTLVHDQLGPRQSSPAQQVQPVPYDRSDWSRQRPAQSALPRLEYRVKEKKLEVQSTADSEKIRADPVVQIGDIKVVVQDMGKEPMVFGKSGTFPAQDPVMANDHEASSSKVADKYHQPCWCLEGLTHTQKRKLQCLRNKEKREHGGRENEG